MSHELITSDRLPEDRVVVQASVSTGDVVLIATTQHELRCQQEVAAWQEESRARHLAVNELNTEINLLARSEAAKKIAGRLEKCRQFYMDMFGSFSHELSITDDDASGGVRVDLDVFSSKSSSHYHVNKLDLVPVVYSYAELGLSDRRVELAELGKRAAETDDELRKWRSELANLAAFERQTRATVAAHSLGQSKEGRTMVAALEQLADRRVSGLRAKTASLEEQRKAVAPMKALSTPETGGERDVSPPVKSKPKRKARR